MLNGEWDHFFFFFFFFFFFPGNSQTHRNRLLDRDATGFSAVCELSLAVERDEDLARCEVAVCDW